MYVLKNSNQPAVEQERCSWENLNTQPSVREYDLRSLCTLCSITLYLILDTKDTGLCQLREVLLNLRQRMVCSVLYLPVRHDST